MNRYSKFSLLAAAIAAASTFAYATQGGMENDAQSITKVKIPLVQAVTTAEQHANGKAARAEYENSKHGWVYDVEVVSGAKVFDVKVDAFKGTVISSAEDKADRDDDHDEQD
ncbi:PepSY domain-containing protein [Herminiimonas aquatilis]|uniref:PepSY domain-containing protein n=1 Tax=Herminiimonas aquatilis TaxID=345342 RepID=A0ABW2J9D9_9BURK